MKNVSETINILTSSWQVLGSASQAFLLIVPKYSKCFNTVNCISVLQMVMREIENKLRKRSCVRKWKNVQEVCLTYKSKRSAGSPGQGWGYCLRGTFLYGSLHQTGESAMGLWDTRTEMSTPGMTSGCLDHRPQVIPSVRPYTSHTVTEGKGEFAGLRSSF